MYKCACSAVAVVLAIASTATASITSYEFDITVDSNSISSGAFSGVLVGAQLTVRYSIDTSVAPTTSIPNINQWDLAAPGAGQLITEIAVTGPGLSYTMAAAACAHAFIEIADDAPGFFDHFYLFGQALAANTDTAGIGVNLYEDHALGPVDTSLNGLSFPTSNGELVPASFDYARLELYGPNWRGTLGGTITAARVPTSATIALLAPAGLVATRRRR